MSICVAELMTWGVLLVVALELAQLVGRDLGTRGRRDLAAAQQEAHQ